MRFRHIFLSALLLMATLPTCRGRVPTGVADLVKRFAAGGGKNARSIARQVHPEASTLDDAIAAFEKRLAAQKQGVKVSGGKGAAEAGEAAWRYERLPNGRLAPATKAHSVADVRIPTPSNIDVAMTPFAGQGSEAAKGIARRLDVDLLLYDSVGEPILYASHSAQRIVYDAALRRYRSDCVAVIDKALNDIASNPVQAGKLSEAMAVRLESLVKSAVKSPVHVDVSTGNVTMDLVFDSGSRVVGTFNMYTTLKSALIVGGTGYYILKKEK